MKNMINRLPLWTIAGILFIISGILCIIPAVKSGGGIFLILGLCDISVGCFLNILGMKNKNKTEK